MKKLCFLFVLLFFLPQLFAQEDETRRLGGFEFGLGMNFLGPKNHMAELMIAHGFNSGIVNWIYLTEEEYPFYRQPGISASLGYNRILKQKHSLGVNLHYSRFAKVYGHSEVSKELDVLFSSLYLNPFYRYELNNWLNLQAGPVLMLNQGKKTTIYDENVEETRDRYVVFSAGLQAGLQAVLWDGSSTYGSIGIHYALCLPSTMGPFSAVYGFNQLDTIPEDDYNFSQLNLVFTMAFHHWHFKGL